MHARLGLTTEYLGEKWFSCIKACLVKAKELNMNAWVYDENGWPSGFVGGKLLEVEEYRARFLRYKENDSFDKEAFVNYIKKEGKYVRVSKEENADKYYAIYLMISPANSDILNPDCVDAFINETHEKYYRECKEYFGNTLKGFFTDEPQYYRAETPYSPLLVDEFKKDNMDVLDGLVYLFSNDENGYEFRTKYYNTLNKLYVNNFYKKLYDWCEGHNCMLTGHSVEEVRLFTQMWGGANVMSSYEYEHIPGVDKLGRWCEDGLAPDQVGSVCSQLGKKYCLTETFGCSGNDVTPKELKSTADYQFFKGVNVLCQHLYPYSMAGQGKWDHPPVFSKHSNWFDGFKVFNDYFSKLGYIVSNTEEKYDVGIISPMRNVYLTYIRSKDLESVKELENNYIKLFEKLKANGVTYQIIDETILSRHGKIKDGNLVVGKNTYSNIIIPQMDSIAKTTLDMLLTYSGKLLALSDIKYVDGRKENVKLVSNESFDEIINLAHIKFKCNTNNAFIVHRQSELGDYLFVKNLSMTDDSIIETKDIANNYMRLDLQYLSLDYITDNFVLPAKESMILIKNSGSKNKEIKYIEKNITKDFVVTDITENFLVLDYISISKDGINYGEYLPIPYTSETLLREDYKGKIYVRQKFNSKISINAKLVLEKANYIYVKFNNSEVELNKSEFDVNFREGEINVIEGENLLEYSFDYYQHDGVYFALFDPLATESLRNCLSYDTSIENAYIKGNFTVSNMVIDYKKTNIPVTSKLLDNGYPFFKGKLSLSGKLLYSGKKTILKLNGRFNEALIKANGKEQLIVLDDKADISNLLKFGENNIEITINSSIRNLFGPHHFKREPESFGVSPYLFNMRGEWGNGYTDSYSDEYYLVPFGIDDVLIFEVE